MEPEFRRGHGSVYDALAGGRIDAARLRRLQVAAMPAPAAEEPLMFGIDVTPLARPDAVFADEMVMVQVRGVGGDRYLPGWPLSVLTGLHWGCSSWVDAIEARRLRPGQDHADVTVAQVSNPLADLAATGKRRPGDPPPLMLLDAGYPATDISHALAGQDVQVLVRLRSDRVFYGDPPERAAGRRGAPRRHGQRFALNDACTHHAPGIELARRSARYGTLRVRAWRGLHQALGRSGRWAGYPEDEQLPVVKGTVICVTVERLPDGRKPLKDPWLWHHGPAKADARLVDLLWKAYLRRFDQEHFHRFAKAYLGLDAAHLASAQATDWWAALVMAAYTQLRLASALVEDLRRPWHKKPEPGRCSAPTGSGWDSAVSARTWALRPGRRKPPGPAPAVPEVEEQAQDPATDLPQKRQQARYAHQGSQARSLNNKLRTGRPVNGLCTRSVTTCASLPRCQSHLHQRSCRGSGAAPYTTD